MLCEWGDSKSLKSRVWHLFWGMQFTRRKIPCFVNRHQVLFPCKGFHAVQSHTAITSIVFYANLKFPPPKCARGIKEVGKINNFRHCEANRRFAEAIQKNPIFFKFATFFLKIT